MRVTLLALQLSLATRLAYSESTCPYRTANYITHGLPQQCLAGIEPPEATPMTNATGGEQISIPLMKTEGVRIERGKPITAGTAGGTATESTETPKSAGVDDQSDDSVLEDKFLTFEDWKKKNLADAGQLDQLLSERPAREREVRRRPAGMNNDIDSIGDDPEIDLNFGFETPHLDHKPGVPTEARPVSGGKPEPRGQARSKMAGKTSKERFNYASFDCAATVRKTHAGAKGANSILVENKDSYMLNQCKEKNKYFVVELCDDILVDTVALGNFEFFSSQFRQFRVSVSDRYPVKASAWRDLGVYEARNTREVQAFLIAEPQIWARYMKVEILSHYGSEFYCPISLFRVHGTTMMEEFKAQMEASTRPAIEDDVDEGVAEDTNAEVIVPPVVEEVSKDANTTANSSTAELNTTVEANVASVPIKAVASRTAKEECISPSKNPTFDKIFEGSTCDAFHPTLPSSSMVYAEFFTSIPIIPTAALAKPPPGTQIASSSSETPSTPPTKSKTARSEKASEAPQKNNSNTPQENTQKAAQQERPPPPQHRHHEHYPPPTTQENFFKTIHKRLAYLEGNATLSLQYIEEQSRMLKEAFSKVEKKQAVRTQAFLDNLNSTVWKELVGFRNQYDQLWQSTVIALQSQKQQSEEDTLTLNSQISLLASEVVYQRRMGYVQSLLLLICILLIIFKQNYTLIENPLVTSIRQRGAFRFLESPPTSPLRGGASTPRGARHHSRTVSMDSQFASPNLDFTPPTPESNRSTPGPLDSGVVVRSSPATPRGERDAEEFETNWRGFEVSKSPPQAQGGGKKKKKRKGGSLLKHGGQGSVSSSPMANSQNSQDIQGGLGKKGLVRSSSGSSGGSGGSGVDYTP